MMSSAHLALELGFNDILIIGQYFKSKLLRVVRLVNH